MQFMYWTTHAAKNHKLENQNGHLTLDQSESNVWNTAN